MLIRGKDVALSLLVVGTAAAVGYVLTADRTGDESGRSKADVGARIVDPADVPVDVTILRASDDRIQQVPLLRQAIDRALRSGAHDEWAHIMVDCDGAWSVVDAIRTRFPYHESDGAGYNGVYVRCDDRIVVIDAIGWAKVEEPLH